MRLAAATILLLAGVALSGCSSSDVPAASDCPSLISLTFDEVKAISHDATEAEKQWQAGHITDNKFRSLSLEADQKIRGLLERDSSKSNLCTANIWNTYVQAWTYMDGYFGFRSNCRLYQEDCAFAQTDGILEGLQQISQAYQMAQAEANTVRFTTSVWFKLDYKESNSTSIRLTLEATSTSGALTRSDPFIIGVQAGMEPVQDNITVSPATEDGAFTYNFQVAEPNAGWSHDNRFRITGQTPYMEVTMSGGRVQVNCANCEWV